MKPMPVFFIDNQELIGPGAKLHGNLVASYLDPPQKFPSYVQVAQSTVAGYGGFVVIIAGPKGIIAHLFDGKTREDLPAIAKITKTEKPSQWPKWIHQIRLDVSAMMHFCCLMHCGEAGDDEINVHHLMDLVASRDTEESRVLKQALKDFFKAPEVDGVEPSRAFQIAENLLASWGV